jgi:predicted small lipoprotein YifL
MKAVSEAMLSLECYDVQTMLRHFRPAAAVIVAVLASAACGIKGPLVPPPATPPAATLAPPATAPAPPSTSPATPAPAERKP